MNRFLPRRPRCIRHSAPPERSVASENGVTVVEMLVASLVLAIGIAGIATVFVASADSVSLARQQAVASDLAAGEVEIIRALPYEHVGISVSADGYVGMFDGRRTVTEPSANRVEPIGDTTQDGVDFEIRRSVTWESIGDDAEGYKVVTVSVRWAAVAPERSVTIQTGLFEAEPE